MREGIYDVAVVGGGFAGAATALLLRRAMPAARVCIIESSTEFPRKVGESATELSTWFLTRVLGLDRHLAVRHLPKYGLRFWFQNKDVTTLAEAAELGNRYQSRIPGLHIERATLDNEVLARATAEGAELLRPARVREVAFEDGAPATLELQDGTAVRARWVVDATGRRAWLARRFGLLRKMPQHPVRTVWGRYTGLRDFDGDWLPGRADGRTGVFCSRGLSTNHLTGDGWWMWVIPLPGGETSVGLLYDERLFQLPPGDDLEASFDAFLGEQPLARELFANAERRGPLHALKNLPYRVDRLMAPGWANGPRRFARAGSY